ncbi:calcium-binding protein [Ruegeria hyattellae]|uniref:calcium-binding protein n=1 Tax=Ruegeria hyattellae TaxID=3233337 RepID=UPI00355B0EA0
MVLQFDGRLATGQEALDGNLRSLHLTTGTGGTVLYAGTGRHGGLSTYALTPDAAAQVVDTVDFRTLPGGVADTQLDMLTMNGRAVLAFGTSSGGDLLYYTLDPDAGFGAQGAVAIPGAGAGAWDAGGSAPYLFALDRDTGVLKAYETSGAGAGRIALQNGADWHPPKGTLVTSLPASAGTVVVAAAGGNASELVSFRMSEPDGTLVEAGRSGAVHGLGFSTPTAMESVAGHGANWVIMAAAGSGTLSVLRVGAGGQLTPTDHLLDTGETRFGGVQALSVVPVGKHVLVFAGGSDDGLAVFSLLPSGRLVHLQSIAEAPGRGLGDVTAIEAGVVGDEVQIFVASESLPGLSQFSWSVASLGLAREGAAPQLQGTAGDDVLLADGPGPVTVTGGGGDDILVAGSGTSVLRGGAGGDLFVLGPSDATQRIADFQPGQDRLDLSHFPLLRSPSQLKVTPLPNGVQLEFQTSRIIVISASGKPLKLSDFWPTGRFSTPDRLLTEAIPYPKEILGSAAADRLGGGTGHDTIRAVAGDDVVWGRAGADHLDGGLGHDRIWGGNGGDTVIGGQGQDTIDAGEGANVIFAGGGSDLVRAGADADVIRGGGGNDGIRASGGRDTVWGGHGNDTLDGAAGRDRLYAGAGADLLIGGADADHLDGGSGHDMIWGGSGADTVIGGWGQDTVGAGDGADTVFTGGSGDLIRAGAGNDLIGGGGGQDRLWGGVGADTAWGGAGDDTLYGDAGRDRLLAGQGADVLNGGEHGDHLDGGWGNDTLWGGAGGDTIFGDWGRDSIGAGDGADRVDGGGGGDLIRAGTGNDTISGGGGPDDLRASDGEDVVWGGDGNDTLDGGRGHDTIAGGGNQDVIRGGDGNDSLAGGAGNDEIWAMNGADLAWGGVGRDRIGGGAGRDTLNGGAGADTLIGGSEADRLTGMAGADIFVFGRSHGHDCITDFSPGQDRIEIGGGIGFSALTIRQVDGGAEITSDFGTILLEGVAYDQLSAGDFLFV